MKRPFNLRSFISFCLLFCIAWLLVTGSILFIAPPGRIANWDNWTLLGFSKRQWQAQHTVFAYTFVVIALIHIFTLNWRNLWSYIKVKTQTGIRRRWELAMATLLILLIFFSTSLYLPPFWSFYQLGNDLKQGWEEKTNEAPMPHAEALSITEFADRIVEMTPEEIIQRLKAESIEVINSEQTIADVAEKNGKSPAELFRIIQGREAGGSRLSRGQGRRNDAVDPSSGLRRGYGRMTIVEVAASIQHSPEEVIEILKKEGIAAKEDETIRDIASANNMYPGALVKLLFEKFDLPYDL